MEFRHPLLVWNACEGHAADLGCIFLPHSIWVDIHKDYPRIRSNRSAIEIKTAGGSYVGRPFPCEDFHSTAIKAVCCPFIASPAEISASSELHSSLLESSPHGVLLGGIGRVWNAIPEAEAVRMAGHEREGLVGMVVIEEANLLHSSLDDSMTLHVAEVTPTGPALVTKNTRITYAPSMAIAIANADFTTVNAASAFHRSSAYWQVHAIISAANNPSSATYPVPRGILLHGPPGVGKTHMVRTVCEDLNVPLTVIDGPQVLAPTTAEDDSEGENGSVIERIFVEAAARISKTSCSVLFIDELDTLAAKRETGVETHQVRQLALLLALFDRSPSRLVVIGATNRPNCIDPAARRSGRLDREIFVEPPDEKERLQILQLLLPEAKGINLGELVRRTPGFVPADLVALAREILQFHHHDDPPAVLMDKALRQVGPSIKRQYHVNTEANLTWADIGGNHQLKEQLQRAIEWPLKYAADFARLGIRSPRGILLHGPPGCSKTMIARVLAHTTGMNFYSLSGAAIYSAYVGEAERLLRETFLTARLTAPSLIFIDEIDALVGKRGGSADADVVQERILSTMLNEMDGIASAGSVTVIGATNLPGAIDSALLRPGRFDLLLEVALPTEPDRRDILQTVSRRTPLAEDVDFVSIARQTVGWSGAQLKALIQEGALLAIRSDADKVSQHHLLAILQGRHGRTV